MDTEFNLDLLLGELPGTYKNEIALIKAIISAGSIHRDLCQALDLINEFNHWHQFKLLPARERDGHDHNHEGLVNHALYVAALASLVRGLDKNSRGRGRIDLVEHLKSVGLEDEVLLIHRFRDTELAHYDKFKIGEAVHSKDSAILTMEDGKAIRIYPAISRYSSSAIIINAAETLLKAAIPYAKCFFSEKSQKLMKSINEDRGLKDLIYSSWIKTGHKPGGFFAGKPDQIKVLNGMNIET